MPDEEKAEDGLDIEKGDEEPTPRTRSDSSPDSPPRHSHGLSQILEERHRSTYYRMLSSSIVLHEDCSDQPAFEIPGTTFIALRAMAFLESLWGFITLIYEGQQPIQRKRTSY